MKNLIIITGPTAVGKSDLSIMLAKKIGGQIISADSMQVYKGMDIGSAKISKEERKEVTHHLIDIVSPDYPFNVSDFVLFAKEAIDKIYKDGAIPILVGGTAFYIQALLKDVDFSKESAGSNTFRKDANFFIENPNKEIFLQFCDKYFKDVDGINTENIDENSLYNILEVIDSKATETIHKNNKKRVIRAIEYFYTTKKPISKHNEEEKNKKSIYNYLYIILNDDRKSLYERINRRVDKMKEDGLLEEVKTLLSLGYTKNMTSMQGIGYKEILDELENVTPDYTLAFDKIKQNTRHFAKRQLTWFRKVEEAKFININELNYDKNKCLDEVMKIIKEKMKLEE